jgi:toxin ParE1/3/4
LSVRVRFLSSAQAELEAAVGWYERKRPGLGVELILEIDEAVGLISHHPESWAVWRTNRPYRKCLLSRFPYVLFYVVDEGDNVEILAVAHTKRKPGYWLERRD